MVKLMEDELAPVSLKQEAMETHYVECSVSGERILLADLKYWCIEKQVAYKGIEVVPVHDFYKKESADVEIA